MYVCKAHYITGVYLQNIALIFQQAFSRRKFQRKRYKFPTTLPCENLKRLLGYKKGNGGINLTLKSDSFRRRLGIQPGHEEVALYTHLNSSLISDLHYSLKARHPLSHHSQHVPSNLSLVCCHPVPSAVLWTLTVKPLY